MFETSGVGERGAESREGLRINTNVQDLLPPQLFSQIRRIIATYQPLTCENVDLEARSLVVFSLDRDGEV